MADLARDAELSPMARQHAEALLASDAARADRLLARWLLDSMKYLDV
mgnify:CR=1 FL=1